MSNPVYIATKIVTDTMTDTELAVTVTVATSGWGLTPEHLCYEKALPLFTEKRNGDLFVHRETLACLLDIAGKRLSGSEGGDA